MSEAANRPMLLGSRDFRVEPAGDKTASPHASETDGFKGVRGSVSIDVGLLADDELRRRVAAIGGFGVAGRPRGVLDDVDDTSDGGDLDAWVRASVAEEDLFE